MSQLESNLGKTSLQPVRKPRSNVYTVMLILALLFIAIGCAMLWLEIKEYNDGGNLGRALTANSVDAPLSLLPRHG